MKTPDEIKKALECCFHDSEQCGDCPYYPVSCDRELVRDAREYIRQLEAERDALLEEVRHCFYCIYADGISDECDTICEDCEADCPCKGCGHYNKFEWRGVQKEE